MSKRIDQPEEETKQSYEIFENKPKNVSLFDERMI